MTLEQELATIQGEILNDGILSRLNNSELNLDLGTSVQQTVLQELQQTESRADFLVEFYKRQLLQHSLIMDLFLLGLGKWFNATVIVHYHRHHRRFRWTWWVVLVALVLLQLGLPFIRKSRSFVKYQKSIFTFQTILIGFFLIGITNYQKADELHFSFAITILLFLCGLMIHDIFQLVLVYYNLTQFNKIFIKFLIFGFLIADLIVVLITLKIKNRYLIAEGIIIYFLYYFYQLNQSLQLQPASLPEEFTIVQIFKNIQGEGQIVPQIQRTQCITIKQVFLIIGVAVTYLAIVNATLIYKNVPSIVFLLIISIQLFSLLIETRVASRSLHEEDVYFAVSLTYLDMISPIKNIFRSLQ